MRILYLHPKSWTGEYPILRQLRRIGNEVCVLEERRNLAQGARHRADCFLETGDGLETLWYDPGRGWEKLLTWPLDRLFKRAFDGRNLVHRMSVILEAVRCFQPDVLVCSDGFSYAIPAALLRRLGLVRTPLIVSYIGGDVLDIPEAEYGHARTVLTAWLIRQSLSGIDMLRPVSPMLREVLLRDGAREDRIQICPSHLTSDRDALEGIFAQRSAISAEIRNRYGLKPEAPLIVTLSGNQKGKGLHILAQAWPAVIANRPDARWLLCGPAHAWLEQAVWPELDRHGLRGTVAASGRLEGMAVYEHLAAADLLVNPTLGEGLNMVVVEAAAVGTPAISSDGAGIAAWIQRYAAGAVVHCGEVQPLANAIISALQDGETTSRWSPAAVSMSREFSLENISGQLLDMMRSLTAIAARKRRGQA